MGSKLLNAGAVVALTIALTSCGYHLRSAIDIPEVMKSVYLEGAGTLLRKEMGQSLKAADGELVGVPTQAGMVIKILRDDMRRRVLSLDSVGKATEFELNYTVSFMLMDASGKVLMEQQELEISRDFFNSQQDILAKNNEESVIRSEIYRQAVRTIVARARAVVKN